MIQLNSRMLDLGLMRKDYSIVIMGGGTVCVRRMGKIEGEAENEYL